MTRKTGVTYDNTQYVVKNTQKEVICKLDYYVRVPKLIEDFVYNLYDREWYDFLKKNDVECIKDDNGIFFYHTTYGYANARDEDDFDVDFGKKLAQTRAQMKAFDMADRIYVYIWGRVSDVYKQCCVYTLGCRDCAEDCYDHTEELVKNKYNL